MRAHVLDRKYDDIIFWKSGRNFFGGNVVVANREHKQNSKVKAKKCSIADAFDKRLT